MVTGGRTLSVSRWDVREPAALALRRHGLTRGVLSDVDERARYTVFDGEAVSENRDGVVRDQQKFAIANSTSASVVSSEGGAAARRGAGRHMRSHRAVDACRRCRPWHRRGILGADDSLLLS